MEIQDKIVNKVAASGLIIFDLATLAPAGEFVVFDVKDHLFHGLILREKDFREFVKQNDWSQYEGKNVAITCSSDAIIPTWAYMLLANKLEPYAREVTFGSLENLRSLLFEKALDKLDMEQYVDQRIMVKGCGDVKVPESAFITLTRKLSKVAKSIMYGEACSSVPIFKRKA
ncbi:DUF2480 family protein [Albibacterium indicum]|uniref:DUF2480 family protein n=1 Tax=Albibacterium indicum TaxID=2292082 RepID=UPI000E4C60D4|nr:DUF2480 family protein [Pedobacter indicus]